VDETVEFDPSEWEQPLGPPEELAEPDRWDYLWCKECRGWGFVRLSWYKGFEASPHWLPCQRCECQRYVRVRNDHLLAYIMYTPSWLREHQPLPRVVPAPEPGCSYATMFQDLLMGEKLFFPGLDEPTGLAKYSNERGVEDVEIEPVDLGYLVYMRGLVGDPS
jgi:hypothetical protein